MVCLYHFDFQTCFLPQRCGHLNLQKCSKSHTVFHSFEFEMCFLPQWRALFNSSTSKSAPRMVCFYHFDFQMCAFQKRSKSRHNSVHFFRHLNPKELRTWQFFNSFDFEMCFLPQWRALFNSSTSKSAPRMVCFYHFDFQMCFLPQQHALFRHLNFQKSSEPDSSLTGLTSKSASRHNSVHFFNSSTFKSGPKMVCFSTFWLPIMLPNVLSPNLTVFHSFDFETWRPAALASLLFDPSEPQNIGKTKCSAIFLPFCAAASSFFWLFLFSQLLFSAFLLPRSSHLCFSSVYIVGRVSSKLPSIIVRMSKIGGKYLRNSSLVCLPKHMSKDSPQNY